MFFLELDLSETEIVASSPGMDVEQRTLTAQDLEAYLTLRPDTRRADVIRRIESGNRCFASWHEGRLVDVCWAATGCVEVPYLRRYMLLDPRDVYLYDSYTAPEYRGYSIATSRSGWSIEIFRREGCRRVVALVAYENYTAWTILTWSRMATTGTYHLLRLPLRGILWSRATEGHRLPDLTRSMVHPHVASP